MFDEFEPESAAEGGTEEEADDLPMEGDDEEDDDPLKIDGEEEEAI
ncbi:MAG: hypothetical protein KGI70_01405 [Patescibacteria group bacterium]|nr:hypothetical protein [Patescibacteria group bacterium]